jgi:hypothetical protein
MTKKNEQSPAVDFDYAECSGDICCPFCKVLLHASDVHFDDIDERKEWFGSAAKSGLLSCEHVGFWSFGGIDEPNVNENWRREMFTLAKVLKTNLEDTEDGYHWQEALNFAIEADGNIGWAAVLALPAFQVAVYKQRYTEIGLLGYTAVILRKKKRPPAQGLKSA